MIYGANGYAGRQLVKEARKQGLSPIIAGRNGQEITALALETGLSCKVFDLRKDAITNYLQDIKLFVNCAGPFSATMKPCLLACAKTHTHYIDVSGELRSLEYIFRNQEQWENAGISVVPAAGFDATPGDCLAAFLKTKLPDATSLKIGIKINGTKPSIGTLNSLIESIAIGGRIRVNNHLRKVANAWKTKLIPFSHQPSLCVSMPLAELSSIWHSTRIPNIEVYLAVKSKELRYLKMSRFLRPLLYFPPILNWSKKQIPIFASPPNPQVQQQGSAVIWGEARNAAGESLSLRMLTEEAYLFTSKTVLMAIKTVLQGKVSPGAHSPSTAMGAHKILNLDTVTIEDIIPPPATPF